jgi:ribosomal protein S18 acetylase RimI-like enzyme
VGEFVVGVRNSGTSRKITFGFAISTRTVTGVFRCGRASCARVGVMAVVQVRSARVGDGPGCAEVWSDAGEHFARINPDLAQIPVVTGLADWFDSACEVAARRDEQLFLVATLDGEVTGLLLARLQQATASASFQLDKDLGRTRVEVTALAVSRKYRRTGAGTALMEAAQKWALAASAEIMVLETEVNNELSVPFYRDRMGFTARLVTFRKDLRG